MKWRKLGVIFRPDGSIPWMRTHAMVPTPVLTGDSVIRVYLSFRDDNNVGRAGFVDLDAEDPRRITRVSKVPVLDIGRPGTFDENGVLPTCIIEGSPGSLYMYYAGFELGTKIRYRLLSGLAVSSDGGETYRRVKKTPILERSDDELYFRGGPFVRKDGGVFRMWYVAGSEWTDISGKPMPVYVLKYLESQNGIDWASTGTTCLELTEADEHGFGRPYVIRDGGMYKLFYSIRKRSLGAYRLGYAESLDGIHWHRRDHELGLDVSKQGWDSQAIMYSAVIKVGGVTYLFYNGNNFGETGFGVAVLES